MKIMDFEGEMYEARFPKKEGVSKQVQKKLMKKGNK
jgi:hypothetical protein